MSEEKAWPPLEVVVDETLVRNIQPRMRLGVLFRRLRMQAGKSLRETAEALSDVVDNKTVLGEIERSRRPATSDQIHAFCEYLGVGTEAFFEAARDYNRSVWEPHDHPLKITEQMAKMASIKPSYDQDELLIALRSAISSMEIGADWLGRLMRTVRLVPGHEQDATTAASVVMMLEAGAQFAQGVLERPIEQFCQEAPPWVDEPSKPGEE